MDNINFSAPAGYEMDFRSVEKRIMEMMAGRNPEEMNPRLFDGQFHAPRVAPTKPKTVKFDALSESAKARVRAQYLETHGVDTDSIQDMLEAELKTLGYPVDSIKYKFNGEDRGVAFYGNVNDWKLTKVARRLLTPRKAWYIRQFMVAGANIDMYIGGHYRRNHKPDNIDVQRDYSSYKANSDLRRFQVLVKELEQAIESEAKFVCKMLLAKGQEMYNELASDAKIDAAIMEQGHDYYESGERHSNRSRSIKEEYLSHLRSYPLFA